MRILVVEGLGPNLVRTLLAEGLRCVSSGLDGLSILLEEPRCAEFDAIILDPRTTEGSQWTWLDRTRERHPGMPVFMVTSDWTREDQLTALNRGADDYLPIPTDPAVLAARVRSAIRRARTLPVVRLGEVHFDVARRTMERKGQVVFLSPKEFDLVYALMTRRGRTVSREELLKVVWDLDVDPRTPLVEVLVSRLRRKLKMLPTSIEHTGEGYVLAVKGEESD